MLATLADIKAHLEIGLADTANDAVLTRIVRAVGDRFARHCGFVAGGLACMEKAAVVEYLSPGYGEGLLWLAGRPVVSVTEIKEALYGDFTSATALVENTDYQFDAGAGRLVRIAGPWLSGQRTVRVTYVGGYTVGLDEWAAGTAYAVGGQVAYGGKVYEAQGVADAAVLAPTAAVYDSDNPPSAGEEAWEEQSGERPVPDELRDACITQAAYQFGRRARAGSGGGGAQGGNYSDAGNDDLLEGVRAILDRYRRVA